MQYVVWLVYGGFWLLLAFDPVSRFTWVLENVVVTIFLVGFLSSHRYLNWSRMAQAAVLGFLVLHALGAHYTYSLVPYDELGRLLFGVSINEAFGWQRNQYDRLVHFAYGFLLSLPMLEALRRRISRRRDAAAITLMLVMSTSLVYEIIEWGAVIVFAGDQGQAFLGAQGDPWDAHKDMTLACFGSLLSVTIATGLGWLNVFRRRVIQNAGGRVSGARSVLDSNNG